MQIKCYNLILTSDFEAVAVAVVVLNIIIG